MAKLNTNAALTWTDPGTGTERVFLLAVPLRDLRPGFSQSAYFAQSLDRTATASVTVGSGANELVGMVRYADDPQALLDLVQAGATQTTLTYIPTLTDPGQSYTVKLVSPVDVTSVQVDLDRQRGVQFGEAEMELRFRKTDRSAFTELYDGTPVLFSYRAGDGLGRATFSRADTATYASKGYGTSTSAASGKARVHWLDTDSDGARETPTLLLEGTSTNLITSSENFGVWSVAASPVLTSGQADPAGGTAAYLIDDDSAVNNEYIFLAPTFTGSTAKAFSVFVKQGTCATTQLALRDTTAPADRLVFNITWTLGVPSVSAVTGTFLGAIRYRDGWYRILGRTTAVTAANTNQMWLRPSGATSATTGSTYFYGAQCEDGLNPTSYIPTSGGTDARTRDACTFPFPAKMQTMTIYQRYVQVGTLPWSASVNSYVLSIGQTSTTETRLSIENTLNAATMSVSLAGLAAGTSGTVANAATDGQVVEVRAIVRYTASTRSATVQLGVTIAGGAETLSTASAAIAVSDGFAANALALNGLGGGTANDALTPTTHVAIVRGVQALDVCRRMAGV